MESCCHQPAVDSWGESFLILRLLEPKSPCIFLSFPLLTIDDINTSQRELYDILSGARTGTQLQSQGNWVHVAVVAEVHVRVTHAVAAGGQCITIKSGSFIKISVSCVFRAYLS